jgi:DNA-binding NarL/FixJ family response regulator
MAVRVLLVDDDQIVRDALVMALRTRELDVVALDTFDPDSVLGAHRDVDPQVVLLDFHLDDSTSSDLIPLLVAEGATVLMLTGANDPEILGSCLDLGAAGIILKRQGLDDLVRAIDLAVEGLAPLRPQERDDLVSESRAQRAARAEALAPFEAMTARERSVLGGLLDGLTAEEIATRDYVSLATVRTQIRGILTKLDVTSQLAAVAHARRAGWTP